jgi:hypothetical protein
MTDSSSSRPANDVTAGGVRIESRSEPPASMLPPMPTYGGRGRLGSYALFGAVAGILPLPWVPDALLKQIRGSMASDLARRYRVTLSPDARAVLEVPWSTRMPRTFAISAAKFAAGRVLGRLGPLSWAAPVRAALATFLFGHLFVRYLEEERETRDEERRLEVSEAHAIRETIDEALLRALTVNSRSPWSSSSEMGASSWVDGAMSTAAGVPEWVLSRVETAFDEVRSEQGYRG